MDDASRVLFLLVVLISLNQLFARVPALHNGAWSYLMVQIINLSAATAVIVFGLPGFEDLSMVRWLLGLLLFWHVARNNFTYREARHKHRLRKRAQTRQAIVRALDDGQGVPVEE